MLKLLIYDSILSGHHRDYLLAVLDYASRLQRVGVDLHLVFMVPADFHTVASPDLQKEGIEFRYLTEVESQRIASLSARKRSYYEVDLIRQVVTDMRIDELFLMNMDYFQVALSKGPGKQLSCGISGIQFQPYARFELAATERGFQPAEFFRAKRKKYRLAQLLSNKNMRRICIPCDQTAVDIMSSRHSRPVRFEMLPEPYFVVDEKPLNPIDIREHYDINRQDRIMLVFGHIIPRKNIPNILQALSIVDRQAHQRADQSMTLLIIGNARESYQQALNTSIDAFNKKSEMISVVFDCTFADEHTMQSAFSQCDIVAMPYLKAYQSSGILFLAARFHKPVITADTGLMNELVSQYQLGNTVNAQSPESIADAISALLNGTVVTGSNTGFFSQHTPDAHAACILNY